MHIFTDYDKPYIIQDLVSPIVPQYFWIFSGPMMDYTLSPIMYIEEITGPTVEIIVEGTSLLLPASWNILVGDLDTCYIDTVPISMCSTHQYSAILMSTSDSKMRFGNIRVVDFIKSETLSYPMIDKGSLMCHPIGPDNHQTMLSISVGPNDLSAKYLTGKSVGDILY